MNRFLLFSHPSTSCRSYGAGRRKRVFILATPVPSAGATGQADVHRHTQTRLRKRLQPSSRLWRDMSTRQAHTDSHRHLSERPVFAKATPREAPLGQIQSSLREDFVAQRARGFSPAMVGRRKDLFSEI